MRLLQMHIDDFGKFHHYDHTFSDGLNVFCEDNGWGKTTLAAFLKAMLYGFGTKRTRDIIENERKRYMPWQGGKYGGSLDFEAGGVRYRIFRSFGETPRSDRARIIMLDTGTPAGIDPDKLGEVLFGLDVNAFQRSVFIRQNGLEIKDAAGSIHARLNMLVSQANDAGAYQSAIDTLTVQIKRYEKTGNRGELPEVTRQIAEKEQEQERLAGLVMMQDEAREQITELERMISELEESLLEKKAHLDEISGDTKKREAARKQLALLTEQSEAIHTKQKTLLQELGGVLPSHEEAEQARADKHNVETLTAERSMLENRLQQLTEALSILKEQYHGILPTAEQLDTLQKLHSELLGVLGTAEESPMQETPVEYTAIRDIAASDPTFPDKLEKAIGQWNILQNTKHSAEQTGKDISVESEKYAESRNRYAEILTDTAQLEQKLAEQSTYRPAAAEAAIKELETVSEMRRSLQGKSRETETAISHANEDWQQQQKHYAALQENASQLKVQTDAKAGYRPECIEPVQEGLHAIVQNRSQLLAEQKELQAAIQSSEKSWREKQKLILSIILDTIYKIHLKLKLNKKSGNFF